MSVSTIQNYSGRPIMRLICTLLSLCLFYSATAEGLNPIAKVSSSELQQRFEEFQRLPKGHFTEKSTRVYFGSKPGRDPIGRGGWWTPQLQRDLKRARLNEERVAPISESDVVASIIPVISYVRAQSGDPGTGGGGGAPGEGGGNGGGSGGGPTGGNETGGGINTNTGNRHVSYPIVSWSARGDSGVNFSLHHNSMGAYSFDLGKGWSHGYDVKLSYTSGSSAIVRYGDGLEIPYSETAGVFNAPAGIHDALVHNTDGSWTITSKDRSKLYLNSSGRLTSVKDKNNNAITITRNSSQKITSISNGATRSLVFSYTSSGLISSVTDPASRVWSFSYNANNDLTGITYPELNSDYHTRSFTYDSLSNIITETDLLGKVWIQTYDSSERLVSFKNPLNFTWTWNFSSTAATMTQPNGKTIVHNYSGGLVASKVDQAGFSTAYVYDADRNVTSFTDKRGKVWSATYNSSGDRLTSTNPLAKTTISTYSTGHDLLSTTDPNGNVSTYAYDSNGNLLTSVDGLGRTQSTVSYNGFGEPISVVDALGRTSLVYYNTQGDVVQTIAPGGVTSSATYDLLGRIASSTDSAGNTSSVALDAWGRAVSATEPGGATSTINYNLEGDIVSATDPLGRTGSRVLDDAGRTISAVNAKGETTSFTYNTVGYLTSVTNGRGFIRSYTFTDRGEVASLTLPDSSVEQWAYNGNGATTAYVNPLGQTINYVYDNAGQQTGVDYPVGLTDTAFAYDNAGRQTSMVDGTGTSSWTYNAASEITSLGTPQGTINYTYNLAGDVASMVDVGTGTTSTTYDSAGRPVSVTDAFGDVSGYVYDSAGRLSRKNNPNGTYEVYAYDSRNRVTSIVTKNSSNAVVQSRVYSYDLASQVTQVVEGGVTTTYGYDAIGQLTSEAKSSGYSGAYTYDANGNRLSRTVNGVTEVYSYDSGDKLLSVSGGSDPRSFAYDAAGRTVGIVRGSGTTSFAYDYESRVTSFVGPGLSNSFVYNGLDTRVGLTDSLGSRSFKRNGVGVTASVLSDGLASFTPSGEVRGGVKTTFSSALKNDDIQTSASQVVSASKVFDAFGNQLSSSGSWKSAFGYAGGFGYQSDLDSGLKLLGHRYYDSSTGRFLTRDPAKDGRNWYGYCNGQPVSQSDAVGLRPAFLYKLVDKFDEIWKWGKTINPDRRYTNKWLRENELKLKVVMKYDDEAGCFADERVLEGEMPGPGNRTVRANKARAAGNVATNGIALGVSRSALDDYNKTIDEMQPNLEGVKSTPFIVSDVIAAFEWLGKEINKLGKEVRGARFEYAESVLGE
ncbi:MAG: RHS repeat-associated core domain-containing protein [Fimbriimonadaceae bacterium]